MLKDLGYAWRGLRRNPSVSVIAVVALGLGIGLTTVMFSIVYGALHRGLPFDGADRIMHLERANPASGVESMEVTIHDFRDWEARQRSFDALGAFYTGTVNLRGTERPIRYDGAFITASAFDVVGVRPVLGRTFLPEDERPGAVRTVLIGHQVWQNDFGGGRDVVGREVTVNGEPGEIIGVMPEGFEFPLLQEVWVPLRIDAAQLPRGEGQSVEVVGRLRAGLGLDAAMTEFGGIAAQLAAEHPETNEGVVPRIKPYTDEFIGEEERGLLYAMLITVLLVLVIACANVANLLLARASTRTRDLAIRTAMGANRWRIVVQLLAEAVVLAAVGAVIGLAVAWIGIDLFDRAVEPTNPPFWLEFRLDGPILLFVVGVSALAALVAGVIPAIKASGTDVNAVLKDESRGSSSLSIGRLSRALVIGEVALSMALLVASGLMLKGIVKLDGEDWGFPTDDVFTARAAAFEQRFPTAEDRLRFWEEIERRVAAVPGVEHAAITSTLPGSGGLWRPVQLDGSAYEADRDVPWESTFAVTPSYFDTFEMELVRGRWIEATDVAGSQPVVVVNQRFVDEYLEGGEALGRRIRFGTLATSDEPWREIVGVVPNYWMEGIGNTEPGVEGNREGLYLPLAQTDLSFASITARVSGSAPMGISAQVRDAVAAVDADTPIYFVQSLQTAIDQNLWFYRIFGNLFLAFGVAALFMASVGLYGVMSFGVAQRTGEMGIRMALGAEARQVLGLVLRQGLAQVVLGVMLGAGLAFFVARGLQLVLYEVEPFDPATFLGVFVLLATTGLLASLVPARRATRVDPMTALRQD